MANVMNRMKKYFTLDYNFIPTTFIIPNQFDKLLKYANSHKSSIFIAKPPDGSQGGGITILLGSQIAKQIPVQLIQDSIVQTYVKDPLLVQSGMDKKKKKFDLRIYALVIVHDPFIVYLADKGLVRFCTEEYQQPKKQNLHNVRMHLTNYALNKLSDKFVKGQGDTMLDENQASKRELSSLWKSLESQGKDPANYIEQIEECIIKSLVAGKADIFNKMQLRLGCKIEQTKARFFQIVGFDIMFDSDGKAWVLEINSAPSLNIHQKDDVTQKKVISDLDLYVKKEVVSDAIKIAKQPLKKLLELEKYGCYRRIVPNPEQDYGEFSIIDDIRKIFEYLNMGKPSQFISQSRFANLTKFPIMTNGTTVIKASYDIIYKNILSKAKSPSLMTFDLFINALQLLTQKLGLFPEEVQETDKLMKLVNKLNEEI